MPVVSNDLYNALTYFHWKSNSHWIASQRAYSTFPKPKITCKMLSIRLRILDQLLCIVRNFMYYGHNIIRKYITFEISYGYSEWVLQPNWYSFSSNYVELLSISVESPHVKIHPNSDCYIHFHPIACVKPTLRLNTYTEYVKEWMKKLMLTVHKQIKWKYYIPV